MNGNLEEFPESYKERRIKVKRLATVLVDYCGYDNEVRAVMKELGVDREEAGKMCFRGHISKKNYFKLYSRVREVMCGY